MKHASRYLSILAISMFSVTSMGAEVRLLQELQLNHTTMGATFTKDFIFTSTADGPASNANILNIFDASTEKLIKSVKLSHSITHIEQSGQNNVLVLGRLSTDRWDGYYTLVNFNQGNFSVKTTKLANQQMFDGVSSSQNGDLFFADMGSRSIYRFVNSKFQRVAFDFSGTGRMSNDSNHLWVLSRGDLFNLGDERIFKVDLKNTKNVSPLNSDQSLFSGLTDLLPLSNSYSKYILASNGLTNQIQTHLKSTGELVSTYNLEYAPYQLAEFGRCVASLGSHEKQLTITQIQEDGSLKALATTDLNLAGDRLKMPRKVIASTQHKKIVVRSAYPCPSCSVTQSSDFVVSFEKDSNVQSCF
jgi:hypothetical protein